MIDHPRRPAQAGRRPARPRDPRSLPDRRPLAGATVHLAPKDRDSGLGTRPSGTAGLRSRGTG